MIVLWTETHEGKFNIAVRGNFLKYKINKKKHRKVRDNKYMLHNVGDNLDRVVRKIINANPGLKLTE